ncbi:hypothetical protein ABIF38_005683 [Bradyrhizobium japonicum]|nr:hypothetical protein [Bradyrhizobium elkanii]MCP1732007.1 hypothetical protein [Bradyrhizobium elkanii]MCS3567341.1 hypothetical protein [Bradyrhizobium elkanii]MCS3591174.1 hypothetical protein [Bradyrhizobium elkanii]MCS3620617.1 hypothetical protein [Bradyrhizobium elkanii]
MHKASHEEIFQNVIDWHLAQAIDARKSGRDLDSARHHRIAIYLRGDRKAPWRTASVRR